MNDDNKKLILATISIQYLKASNKSLDPSLSYEVRKAYSDMAVGLNEVKVWLETQPKNWWKDS